MIPTHSSEKTQKLGVVINQLGLLNNYDYREPHRHDYFELFYFKKGGGDHLIDFISFPIADNSVHLVAPGQVHQLSRALDSEGFVVLFELHVMEPPRKLEAFLFEHACLSAEELCPTFTLRSDSVLNFPLVMSEAFALTKERSDINQLKIVHAIQLFCIACMEVEERLSGGIENEYLTFRKLLKQNFSTKKKVGDYASMMNLTDRSLNDLVKKNAGKSVSEVIYSQIIMEAKRLLRTGISVKETSYLLNFEDPAHFSKFFKTKTGISPSEFHDLT